MTGEDRSMNPRGRDGDRRAVVARWSITGELQTTTASQIGSREGDVCDATFDRTPDGQAFLAGSTLAGALRSTLSDRRQGYRSQGEPEVARRLFGDAEERESPAIVFDSVADGVADSSIRDGVRIVPETGTADDTFKFDREVALPGVRFPIRVDLVVTEGLDEREVLGALVDALDGLSDGSIRLGARKSRGLGACRASDYRARRFDLNTQQGWQDYAASDPEKPTRDLALHPTARAAVAAAHGPDLAAGPDCRRKAVFTLDLEVNGTLLIRTPGVAADDPDAVHLSEQGRQMLSGTSLAGALRAHAGRVLHTLQHLGLVKDNGVSVEGLFGSRPREGDRSAVFCASRVRVDEAVLSNDSRVYRQSRNRIDRFTGGTVDQALFEEQPCVGGRATVQVDILNPSPAEIGLVALVARDLCDGLLPLGGGASVGRGVMKGCARVCVEPGAGTVGFPELQAYVDALAHRPEGSA
ncbi:MAG: RAMP superfamily CRISPR-associated protein [Candidatus Latescibacterota bacterium]